MNSTAKRKYGFLSIGLLPLLVFGLISATAAQTTGDDEVIKVETSLISLPITVLDRNGRYIADLKKENFKVIEEGTEQEVEYFGTVDKPVTVVLLMDCSGSMGPNLNIMANAAMSFISRLRNEDQINIVSFAYDPEDALPMTKVKSLQKSIQIHQRSRVHTRLYNSVDFALRKIQSIEGRKAIILFSDGISDEAEALAKKNMSDAEELETLIYTVRFSETTPQPQVPVAINAAFKNNSSKTVTKPAEKMTADKERKVAAYMNGLAAKTGGRAFRIEAITDLQKTFGDIAAELRRQYTIGYYSNTPGSAGQHRNVKVQVNVPGAIVRTRNGVMALERKK